MRAQSVRGEFQLDFIHERVIVVVFGNKWALVSLFRPERVRSSLDLAKAFRALASFWLARARELHTQIGRS